jgi:hypothetical protein
MDIIQTTQQIFAVLAILHVLHAQMELPAQHAPTLIFASKLEAFALLLLQLDAQLAAKLLNHAHHALMDIIPIAQQIFAVLVILHAVHAKTEHPAQHVLTITFVSKMEAYASLQTPLIAQFAAKTLKIAPLV